MNNGNHRSCIEDHEIVINSGSGYLAINPQGYDPVGTESCPWNIRVPDGQKIQLDIFTFNSIRPDTSIYHGMDCPVYITVEEGSNESDKKPCNQPIREQSFHTTSTNNLRVYFTPTLANIETKYLIKYYRKYICT